MSQTQVNLANQRKAASRFVRDYPNPKLERIRFTNEGDRPGLGYPWSANAIVTVDGDDYNSIIGSLISAGEPLPAITPGPRHVPVTVIYSDGTSEELK